MPDGRRLRGDRTRERVLGPAVALATTKGLEGFSLADLADASGVSKAGIAALFGSKQSLQTEIAARARLVLDARVFSPVRAAPRGLPRLETLGRVWIDYLSDPDLRGGCFFAAASFEFDAQPGPLREIVRGDMGRWVGGIQAIIEDGQSLGQIVPAVNAADEAFELFSIGVTANLMIQLGLADQPADRARRVWTEHLDRLRLDHPTSDTREEHQ